MKEPQSALTMICCSQRQVGSTENVCLLSAFWQQMTGHVFFLRVFVKKYSVKVSLTGECFQRKLPYSMGTLQNFVPFTSENSLFTL